jgi:tetratricopeptide (TPR) repeat protein
LRGWDDQGILRKISLPSLDGEAKRSLISGILPSTVPATLIDMLVESCGEFPGAITATLESLVGDGIITGNPTDQATASAETRRRAMEDSRSTALRLLECAHETTRNALEMLAVGKGAVELAVLARAIQLTPESLKATLEKSPLARIISFKPTTTGIFCYLERRSLGTALMDQLKQERLKTLHDRLADAFEQSPTRDDRYTRARIICHRLSGMNPRKGMPSALEFLPLWAQEGFREDFFDLARLALECAAEDQKKIFAEIAGDMSMARGAAAEAICYFKEALKPRNIFISDRARCERKLASAYMSDGNYAEARNLLEPLLDSLSGGDVTSEAEAARVRLELGMTYRYESKFDLAQENFRQAAAIAANLSDEHLAANALAWIGRTHRDAGSLNEATRALLSSLFKFRRINDKVGAAVALATLGHVAMLRGKWVRANDFLRRALPSLREKGHLGEAARTLSNIGAVWQRLCMPNEATEYYEEALSLYSRLGRRRQEAAVLTNMALLNEYHGRLEPALALAREALKICPSDPNLCCQIMLRIASTQLAIGNISSARDMGLRALKIAAEGNLQNAMEFAGRVLGEIEELDGNSALAREHLESALALSRKMRDAEREGLCLARLAEVAVSRGDLDAAFALATEACAKADSTPVEAVKGVAHSAMGKVLIAGGDPENALAHLLGTERFYRRVQAGENLIDVTLQLGRAYAQLGHWRFAAYYYRTALNTVEQVANQMTSELSRSFFLQDVRRQELFDAICDGKNALKSTQGIVVTKGGTK